MTKKHSTQADDTKLVKLADELEADAELHGATLEGLQARIDANIAALGGADIDATMAAADQEVAELAATALKEDTADMEELSGDIAAADEEEDQLLIDDELPVAETAAKLTPEETGLPEQE